MGRKKIEFKYIDDERIRRVTFKKRRIGLIKKAIQMSKLTNTYIYMKIYCPEDSSLVEYSCTPDMNLEDISESSTNVESFSKILNSHYDMIAKFESRVDKTGHLQNIIEELKKNIGPDYEKETIGINMTSMFSLAKVKNRNTKSTFKTINSRQIHENENTSYNK